MTSVIVPIGRSAINALGKDGYPELLTHVNEKPLIGWTLSWLSSLPFVEEIILIGPQFVISELNLERISNFYSDVPVEFVSFNQETQGAACSILLAAESYVDKSDILVSSINHFVESDITAGIEHFKNETADGGVFFFNSVHPKWSYAKIDNAGNVYEVREKEAISTNALTGLFYFREGRDLFYSLESMLLKRVTFSNKYFVAPAFNELILKGKKISSFKLTGKYFNFFSSIEVERFANSRGEVNK